MTSHRRPFLYALVLPAAITSAGCSSYLAPVITLADVSLGDTTDEGFVLDFDLELSNPNPDPLELEEFQYDVLVNGVAVYHGRRSAEAVLSAGRTRHISIPAVVTYESLGVNVDAPPASFTYTLDGAVWYLTPGELAEILFDSNVRRPKASFNAAGEIVVQNGG